MNANLIAMKAELEIAMTACRMASEAMARAVALTDADLGTNACVARRAVFQARGIGEQNAMWADNIVNLIAKVAVAAA